MVNEIEITEDLGTLGFQEATAITAAKAIAAAMTVGEYTPPGLLAATAVVLGMTEDAANEPLSNTYKRAACALEWGDAKWMTFGRLPSAGGWSSEPLPKKIEARAFVWTRVHTEGTGNGGRWVPGRCKTPEAKAIFAWFRHQTAVPFYGGYWWEAVDTFGPQGLDEVGEAITRARELGYPFPNSCAAAARIDERLGRLSGPRMWALVGAVAPYDTWHPKPGVIERLREERRIHEIMGRLPEGVTFSIA